MWRDVTMMHGSSSERKYSSEQQQAGKQKQLN